MYKVPEQPHKHLHWRTRKIQLCGRIIKTLVKLQCLAHCISSYNMKATMCQQCCKSGSSKIYKFIVGRLYVLLRSSHCSTCMLITTCNSQSENVLQTIWTNWNNFISTSKTSLFVVFHSKEDINGTKNPKRRPNFSNWEIVAMISMV